MSANAVNTQARFLEGSIMRHVVVMTLTGAFGLMSMFAVDLADLYFLSLLNNTNVTAAIGFAGTIAFANLSLALGVGIAAAALVARNLGAGNMERAKEFATSGLLFALLVAAIYAIGMAFLSGPLLRLLGANGEALAQAQKFIWTLTPGFVMIAGGVACSFILRGLGDARRSMYVTLSSAVITALLDPLMIFTFKLGMQGAAVANVIAYLVSFSFGLYGLKEKHNFLNRLSFAGLKRDFSALWTIAWPAILTQLATPFAMAYSTYAVAPFGNEAVAASATIGRIVPVAFGVIFSLSSAIGPIVGQNFGAKQFDRVRQALYDGLKFSAVYTVVVSAMLYLFRHQLADIFLASGRTKELIVFFCTFIALSWAFAGAQFVAQAAFNNLDHAKLSTLYNWGKSTIGTIPPAIIGGMTAGPEGIMVGMAIGSVVFGIATVWKAFAIVNHYEQKATS